MAIAANRDWLADRRDLYVRNIVKDFFQSYDFFLNFKSKFQDQGLSYEGMDQWVGTQGNRGTLWQLKDLSHDLWQNSDPDKNPDTLMFDWMIGTLFHEAMKLKENLYVLVNYRPVWDTIDSSQSDRSDAHDKYPSFFQEITEEINRGIKRIQCLYHKCIKTLQVIITREKDNALLVRYILDSKREAPELWTMKDGLGTLLEKLFPDGIHEAYLIAGESYLEGSWYTEAKIAFEQALQINPECREAKSALRILEKRLNEISVLLEREYTLQQNNHQH